MIPVVILSFVELKYVKLGYSVAVSAYVLFYTIAHDLVLTTFFSFGNLAFLHTLCSSCFLSLS